MPVNFPRPSMKKQLLESTTIHTDSKMRYQKGIERRTGSPG